MGWGCEGGGEGHTSGLPCTHSSVRGAVHVAASVPHARVVQPFVAEVLAVQVLDAPEAAGGKGGFLGAFGDGGCGAVAAGGVGGYAEAGGGCEGAEEARREGRHGEGHGCDGDYEGEEGGGEDLLRGGGWCGHEIYTLPGRLG